MAAEIINVFDVHEPVLISYGLTLELQADNVEYRNKIGTEMYVEGTYIGSVEVDYFEAGRSYYINVGEVLKIYGPKPIILGKEETNLIVPNVLPTVEFKPYSRHKIDADSPYGDKDMGTARTIKMQRGVHKDHYFDDDDTPKRPSGSMIFYDRQTGPNSRQLEVYTGSYKKLYYNMMSDYFRYSKLSGRTDFYHIDSSGNEVIYRTDTIDLSNKDNLGNIAVISLYVPGGTPLKFTKAITTFNEDTFDRATDNHITTEYVWTITTTYKCAQEYDFQFDVLYLDASFNWASIPFMMKNKVSVNREVNTQENYNFKRTDYFIRARKTYDLTSDYLTKTEAEEAMFLPISESFVLRKPNMDYDIEARLINKDLDVISNTNQPMSQLFITVEMSNLILTP